MKRLAFLAALAFAGIAFAAEAPAPATPPAQPIPVRGTVVSLAADSVTLKSSKDGAEIVLGLAPTWTVSVMKPIGIGDIKTGDFIGTAEMPQDDGTGRSLEVHVFPPGVKMGEGHYAWDLAAGSMMTNGTAGEVSESADGRTIVVDYETGTRTITVPNDVPIVQITDGTRDEIVPGVAVFAIGFPTPDGKRAAGALAIGENGTAPPM